MLPNQTCLTSCWVGKRAGEGKTQKFRGREGICFGGHVSSPFKKKKKGHRSLFHTHWPACCSHMVTKVTHFLSAASKSPVGTGGGHRFGGQGELWCNRLGERREHEGKVDRDEVWRHMGDSTQGKAGGQKRGCMMENRERQIQKRGEVGNRVGTH